MSNTIYILTGPVHTGKTHWLRNKVIGNNQFSGILQPVVDGKRTLYDIHSKSSIPLEAGEGDENAISIGRYRFSRNAFDWAKDQLLSAVDLAKEWLVIDEIGKLEIERNEGLEPVVSQLIKSRRDSQLSSKLLLVIRDYLLENAIKKYDLDNASVTIFDSKKDVIL